MVIINGTTGIDTIQDGTVTSSDLATSIALTGVPTAPTATSGTNTTQIATTAFVVANGTPSASPALTGTPTAPTATAGTNTTQLATTAFAKTQSESVAIGVNQTWQDVTASRAIGTTYTNSTGKPIEVLLTATQVGGGSLSVTINGALIYTIAPQQIGEKDVFPFIVQNGMTYLVSGTMTKNQWMELR